MSYASARSASALITTTVGAVIGVGALTFTATTERWLAFGGGCVALAAIALASLFPRRGAIQRALDLPGVLAGAWLIVAARAIESGGAGASPHAVKWLDLGGGAALCGIGIVSLVLHEVGIERDLRRLARDSWAVQVVCCTEKTESRTLADGYEDALSRTAG